jgi:toxin ParE1/3/4
MSDGSSVLLGTGEFSVARRRRDDLLPGLRTTGFERRVTIAFVVAEDAPC